MSPAGSSGEQRTRVGEVELAHEQFGDPTGRPLILVMGIGTQMIGWHEELCERFASRGFYVVRFDNRDSGRSTWLDDAGLPSVTAAWQRTLTDPPYLLADMAGDVAALIEALGLESAHVVGASLGGFVAQTLAIERPERVRSLTSIMSSTGEGSVGYPSEEALEILMRPPAPDRAGYIEGLVAARGALGSPGFETDETWVRDLAGRAWDRGINPAGTQRQLVASICSGDRTEDLRRIEVPTLVLHGTDDPLIHVSGGRATAAAVPGAELIEIDGWGHDLPRALWDRIVDAVAAHAERADARAENLAS